MLSNTELKEAEQAVRTLIAFVGVDPDDKELLDTPRRVLAFLNETRLEAEEFISLTTFSPGTEDLTVIRNVAFHALCSHHMLPYFGHMDVGYLPHDKLLGLSKIPRIVRKAAAGLTTQERVTHVVADQVAAAAGTPDVAVRSVAVHTCAVMRGARAIGTELVASATLGAFRDDAAPRQEFAEVLRGGTA